MAPLNQVLGIKNDFTPSQLNSMEALQRRRLIDKLVEGRNYYNTHGTFRVGPERIPSKTKPGHTYRSTKTFNAPKAFENESQNIAGLHPDVRNLFEQMALLRLKTHVAKTGPYAKLPGLTTQEVVEKFPNAQKEIHDAIREGWPKKGF